jgi:AcrR family transcriptional regulator
MTDKPLDGLDLLWQRLDRPVAEPRPGLSLTRIVRAAVELADAEGLDAVSMSRIAGRLGFTTMSLYRHVRTKNDLLLLMIDAVAAVPGELDEPYADWREGLRRWCHAHAALLRRHEWVARIPIAGPPTTPNQLAWIDRGLRVLDGTGLTENDKVAVLLLLSGYLLTEVRMSGDLARASVDRTDGAAEPVPAPGRLLAAVDAERFPALRRAIDAGAFGYPGGAVGDEGATGDGNAAGFLFGLARILDGVEALIRQRRSEAPS